MALFYVCKMSPNRLDSIEHINCGSVNLANNGLDETYPASSLSSSTREITVNPLPAKHLIGHLLETSSMNQYQQRHSVPSAHNFFLTTLRHRALYLHY